VNAYAVRDVAQPDEEFGNSATQKEFRQLIPKDEVWLSEKTVGPEGLLFMADAVTRLKQEADGVPEGRAYTAGLNVERLLRERLNGVKFRAGRPYKRVPPEIYVERYITLPDVKFPVEVWVVDAALVRSLYKTDYTEGGHGYVYRWVPKGEIWIEHTLDYRELPFIVAHEYLELRLMRDARLDYDTAHAICSKVEFKLRKNLPIKMFLAPGRRKMTKRDLPRLTAQDFFDYVVQQYVKTRVRGCKGNSRKKAGVRECGGTGRRTLKCVARPVGQAGGLPHGSRTPYWLGSLTRPRNRTVLVAGSRITYTNGWSARNVTGGGGRNTAVGLTPIPVAAAASVPFSSTLT
jgi:hypothetical protein